MQFGLSGNFLALVKAMYAQMKSCVRANYGLTCTFKFECRVRQGCLLSPILFARYMNDLEKDLSYKAKGINLWDQFICSMLYADDLILLTESASDLQMQMDLLSEYAKKWNLEINISKTKVLVFNKSDKTSEITWSIDNEIVEEVDSYTYFGVILKKNGLFKKMLVN